jgi:threonine dehydrogenase-like Zn-dependent dehydrogenase
VTVAIEARYHRLVAPRTLRLEAETLHEDRLADDEIFCRTRFSAVSPGTELAAFNGLEPLRPTKQPYPRWLGYMNLAEVIAAGSAAAATFLPGALVYTHVAHRSHYKLPAARVLSVVPPALDPALASLAYLYRLALAGLRRGRGEPGRRIGTVGLGAIGLCAVQLAHLFGREVLAVSDHESARQLAESHGGRAYSRSGAESHFDAASDEDRCDSVLVTTNAWRDWDIALSMTRYGAVVSILGFPGRGQPAPANNPLSSRYVYDRQLALVAAGMAGPHVGDGPEPEQILRDDIAQVFNWMGARQIDPGALCLGLHPALDLEGAYARLQSPERAPGTVVLDWTSS